MTAVVLLLFLVLLIWFWLDSRRAHEIAVAVCRHACAQAEVQLLDDTVSLHRLGIGRDAHGRVRLRRCFTFDFSVDGTIRRQGYLILRGLELELLHLEPRGAMH